MKQTPAGRSIVTNGKEGTPSSISIDGFHSTIGSQFYDDDPDIKKSRNAKFNNLQPQAFPGYKGYNSIVATRDIEHHDEVIINYGDAGEEGDKSSYFNSNFTLDTSAQSVPEEIICPPPTGDLDFGNLANIRRRDLASTYSSVMGEKRDILLPFNYNLLSYLQEHDTPTDPIDQVAGGILSYSIHGDILYIEEIFTSLRHRQQAILISLLTALLTTYPQACSIHLVTRPHADQDRDAMTFYTTLGFVPIRKCNRITCMASTSMEPGYAYYGTSALTICNYLSNRVTKWSDTHRPSIGHFPNTPNFNDLTFATRSILIESQAHHAAGEDDPGGAGDQASIIDIIINASHHLVAFVDPLTAGRVPYEGATQDTNLVAQVSTKDTGIPLPQSPDQPARAHCTSPRALHGRSPPVGVELTDWVAAPATLECMPESVSGGAHDRE